MRNVYRELDLKSVLLVGDDPWTRETLSVFFHIQGCRFRSASGGREAAAALSSDHYDLILSEDRLPDMDGLAFLNACRNYQPRALKFLITAYPNDVTAEDTGRSGVDDVIRKPFIVESLEIALEHHVLHGRSHDREPLDVG